MKNSKSFNLNATFIQPNGVQMTHVKKQNTEKKYLPTLLYLFRNYAFIMLTGGKREFQLKKLDTFKNSFFSGSHDYG
jgi:hypothetical protein